MPTGRSRFWMTAGPEFQRTANALRAVDSSLPSWLRREIRDTATPFVQRAKSRVRSVEVSGGPSHPTGLRRKVAAGVRVRAGVGRDPYFRVETTVPQPSLSAIPRGLDNPAGWRHPVFGNKDVWVNQLPLQPGWFTDTFNNSRDEFQDALTDVLEEARDRIAGAG